MNIDGFDPADIKLALSKLNTLPRAEQIDFLKTLEAYEYNKNMSKSLDNSFINKLGWKSKTSLTEGLNYTIDWYNKEYN